MNQLGVTGRGPAAARHPQGYSVGEEIANGITHGLGVVLSIVAITLLVAFAALFGTGWHLASGIVFGFSLVLLYTASTLYHSFPWPRVKHIFKVIDHAGIYLLIAGTYTPFALITLRDDGGWWLFGIVWAIALIGIAVEAFWVYRPRWTSVLLYVGMGWLAVLAARPLFANLESGGVWLLVAGGLLYTLGTVFYMLKKVPFAHAVWHLFVLGGSVCHFLAVVLFVFPGRA